MIAVPDRSFWIDRSDCDRLVFRGPERAKFLHNLCTNDIKALREGRGCEAFVTSPQGKALGFVTVLCGASDLLIRADPGGLAGVLPHFAKYGVFDDVSWDDPAPTVEVHVAGPAAVAVLSAIGLEPPGAEDLAHREGAIRVVRESPYGVPGITILGDETDRERIFAALGAIPILDEAEAERLRIVAGTPRFGRDVTAENLPQEIGRDARAISFVKGCYLGQETVARLDALGHVNKILKGLRMESGPVPAAGASLLANGAPAGVVTSSATDASGSGGVALAMVRAKHALAGTLLTWDGAAEGAIGVVADLPMIPVAGTGPSV